MFEIFISFKDNGGSNSNRLSLLNDKSSISKFVGDPLLNRISEILLLLATTRITSDGSSKSIIGFPEI